MSHFNTILVSALASALLVAGCAGGYSTQEANEICGELDVEETRKSCIICFESCATCLPQGTMPETFACSEE